MADAPAHGRTAVGGGEATGSGGAATGSDSDERLLIDALRRGDQAAFVTLIDRLGPTMLRIARMYVATTEAAEDVVQETWLAVLRGVDRFEGRSSLKTWIFRILTNQAQTKGSRDSRSVPFSSLAEETDEENGPTVDAARFRTAGRWAGFWATPPRGLPEERVLADEVRDKLEEVLEGVPEQQRAVIALRDIHGWTPAETCELLGISEANQRVLLHRARARCRNELEAYLATTEVER